MDFFLMYVIIWNRKGPLNQGLAHSPDLACRLLLYNPELSMVFIFPKEWLGEKKAKEWYFMTRENFVKFRFQCPEIKFYWNPATSIHLPYDLWLLSWQSWVSAAQTVLPTKPKVFTLWLFTEIIANPWSKPRGRYWPSPRLWGIISFYWTPTV